MTTTIHSKYGAEVRLTGNADGGEHLLIDVGRSASKYLDPAEFLAAVETELDCIIIPRTDLPEVEADDEGIHAGGTTYLGKPNARDAETARWAALQHLALAEYLDAHPPVNETQVNAMCKAIDAADLDVILDPDELRTLARRLVEQGVTVKEEPR